MAIVKRLVKGSALTHSELDGNFSDLDARSTASDDAIIGLVLEDDLLGARITDLEVTQYSHGIEDYNDSGSSQTLAANTPVKITNDGAGAFTNKAYKIPGRNDIWNTVTSQFDWTNTGLVLGDTVLIRMDFAVTTTGANEGLSVELNLAVGSGAPYALNAGYREYRSAGTYNWTIVTEVYMGDLNTLNNPAEITMTAENNSDTVVYKGHYVKYALRTPSAT